MPTKTTQKSTVSQNQQYSGTQAPVEMPEYGALGESLRGSILERLNNPQEVPEQYGAIGVGNVNKTYNTLQQSLQSRLAARGLTGGGVEGNAMTQLEMGRGGGVVDVLNQVPILQRQWEQEDLMNALRLYMTRPMGQTTSGTSEGTSEGTQKSSTMNWMDLAKLGLKVGSGLFG